MTTVAINSHSAQHARISGQLEDSLRAGGRQCGEHEQEQQASHDFFARNKRASFTSVRVLSASPAMATTLP